MIFIYSYFVGRVASINRKSITLETSGIGYCVYVSQPERFMVNTDVKVYLNKRITQNNKGILLEELYGFIDYKEKILFLDLLKISGIGPKTAIVICKNGAELVHKLIGEKNVDALSSLEGVNAKIAKLLIENIPEESQTEDSKNIGDLIAALKALGYQEKDITFALKNIPSSECELSDLISQAIKTIAGGNYLERQKA